jgi:hypothetical protein
LADYFNSPRREWLMEQAGDSLDVDMMEEVAMLEIDAKPLRNGKVPVKWLVTRWRHKVSGSEEDGGWVIQCDKLDIEGKILQPRMLEGSATVRRFRSVVKKLSTKGFANSSYRWY